MINSTATDRRCLTTTAHTQLPESQKHAQRKTTKYHIRPRVSTLLSMSEQEAVTAAGFDRYETVHRESIHAVFEDFRNDRTDAAIISVARLSTRIGGHLAELARGFPGRPVVGLVLEADDADVLVRTLQLGRDGVDLVVDVRHSSGWDRLRAALGSPRMMESFRAQVLARVHAEVGRMGKSLGRFFDLIFDPTVNRTKQIADDLGVRRSAFHSRFHRAALPSARRYLDYARLVRVAFIGQEPALTGTDIANRVHASSPQSLHRSIRCLTGLSFREFRYRFDGAAMLERFVSELVTPNVERLRAFEPQSSARRLSNQRNGDRTITHRVD